jgi:uncharacterized protein
MRRLVKKLLALGIVGYFALVSWIYFNQASLMYFPDKNIGDVSTYNLNNTKEVFLVAEDGKKIQTWYHPANPGKPMMIWLHGNSHNLADKSSKFRQLLDMGYGFIAPSWRGFGKSEGAPSKEGLYKDARAAINFLTQIGYQPEEAIIVGESLGSGIAVKMATEYKFKGVLLITPYTTIADRAQEIYWYFPLKKLVNDDFSCIAAIDQIDTPLLIVHGTEDTVIPLHHSEALINKAQEPKKLVIYEGKGHNNIDSRKMFSEVDAFFNTSQANTDTIRQDDPQKGHDMAMLEAIGW